jgi:hypothetical protein
MSGHERGWKGRVIREFVNWKELVRTQQSKLEGLSDKLQKRRVGVLGAGVVRGFCRRGKAIEFFEGVGRRDECALIVVVQS